VIDTHLHLLDPARFNYRWAGGFPALQGTFNLEDYRRSAPDSLDGAVFMEVDVDWDQAADEARHFCRLAEEPGSGILGVVAAARPERDRFGAQLENILHSKLKGLRRVLHTQPDELSQTQLFRRNIRSLGRCGFPFDLCVQQRQLGLAIELVRDCPGTIFVLDHAGIPDIAAQSPGDEGFRAWRRDVCALAAEPHVNGKISGLTAYARPDQRNAAGLQPYIDTMIEAFGPGRLVWGGDWPVCNLGSGLPAWCGLSRQLLAGLSADEQAGILVGNACRIYSLDT
jgi:predicted TIM-barrel fold metal-dependent hydrolase